MTLTGRPPTLDPAHAIEFDRVTRRFTIHHERAESFQDWFIHRFRRRGGPNGRPATEEFAALDEVSFAVRRGETLGLVGRNGAGKSTLLKLVTGILEPTAGAVRVSGRTYAMLELGAGFHPELSGRDNIYLNGSIYGHGRKAMRRRYEQIVEFADLADFIDTPVKHYSSGMFMRLGFATAIHMDPEILVVDEVMAVGDAGFRRKCHDAIRDLQRRGVTVLLVSHDSEEVREFCHRAILLSRGRVTAEGQVEEVLTEYARLQLREQGHAELTAHTPAPGGDHVHAQFGSVVLRDGAGQPVHAIPPGSPLGVDLLVLGDGAPVDLILRWRTPLGLLLFEDCCHLGRADGTPRRACCHFPAFPVRSGEAVLDVGLRDPSKGVIVDNAEARVHIDGPAGPLLEFERRWELPVPGLATTDGAAAPGQPPFVASGAPGK